MRLALTNCHLYTPLDSLPSATVLIEDGRVASFGPRGEVELPPGAELVDVQQRIVAPGFIDIHTIGCFGRDVMEEDAAGAALFMAQKLPAFGVTAFQPTPVTSPLDVLEQRLASLSKVVGRPTSGANIIGIHMEGPFFNHQYAGAQPREFILPPRPADARRLLDAAGSALKMLSLAPELPGALHVIRLMRENGVVCSAAHTAATYDELMAAIEAGLSMVTHIYSGMRPFFHRDPGIIGAAFTDQRVRLTLIADLIHAHPSAIAIARAMTRPDRLIFITDQMKATGLPDGEYTLVNQKVRVERGAAILSGSLDDPATVVLAGSLLTMDQAVRNAAQKLGWPLQEALAYASVNPARALGLSSKGIIEKGADADLVILNDDLTVWRTIVSGKVVYDG
jgi:N-acetylglucosamine-6-phosphate deacetylase